MINFETMNDGYKPIDTDVHKAKPSVKKNPLDLSTAKKALSPYQKICKAEWEWASDLKIESAEDKAKAADHMLQSSKKFKQMEEKRKGLTKKAREFTSNVNALFKSVGDYLSNPKSKDGAVEIINQKIINYATQEEFERRKKEREAQEATAKLQKAHEKEAKKIGVAPVTMPTPVIPRQTGPVRSEFGSVSGEMVWKWEEKDGARDQVPREYMTIDDKAIDDAVKAGIRDIPGIRIYEEYKTRKRTA